MQKLQALEVYERPREKLAASGPQRLSDRELLALLLCAGTKRTPVLKLADSVLEKIDTRGSNLTIDDLCALDGIGRSKATLIVAALEFSRRRIHPSGHKISGAADVYPLLRHHANKKQEYFLCVSLNGAHEVIAVRVITMGLLNRTQVHPREIFADALTDRAAAVIVAHNHPSGDLTPSDDDTAVTRRLVSAGKILGVPVLDHLIFSDQEFFSYSNQGLI